MMDVSPKKPGKSISQPKALRRTHDHEMKDSEENDAAVLEQMDGSHRRAHSCKRVDFLNDRMNLESYAVFYERHWLWKVL